MIYDPFKQESSDKTLSSPPSSADYLSDSLFRFFAFFCTLSIIFLVTYIVIELSAQALPAIKTHGIDFITDSTWDSNQNKFSVLPEIWGTIYSSLIALVIGGLFGIGIAIFLTQSFVHAKLEVIFRTIIELLAAIPSVVYGLWGIYVLIPLIRPAADWLHQTFGWFPLFSTELSGPGLAPAALVLSIMILPTVAAISADAFRRIPYRIKEAAYGMGATKWEVILKVMLPTASSGILAGVVLGFGKALGETMALAMLIGNINTISVSLFSPANTLASLLASTFPEAGELEVQALMYAALVLLAITFIVNVLGLAVQQYTMRKFEGKK